MPRGRPLHAHRRTAGSTQRDCPVGHPALPAGSHHSRQRRRLEQLRRRQACRRHTANRRQVATALPRRRHRGPHDELRPGRPRTYDDDQVSTAHCRRNPTPPRTGARVRSATGISKHGAALARPVRRALGADLHRPTRFSSRVRDIVGLYLNPPDHAMVLCGREVAGAQSHPADAADGPRLRRRLHPRLRPARHDDAVRRPGHRHRQGVRAVPEAASPRGVPVVPAVDRPGGAVGPVLDNYATHKTPRSGGWRRTRASICISRPPRRPG